MSTERDCDQSRYEEKCSEPYRDFVVEEYFPHENYNPYNVNQHNDIAILRLSEKIEKFTIFITPICLPLDKSVLNADFVQKKKIVTGWGK